MLPFSSSALAAALPLSWSSAAACQTAAEGPLACATPQGRMAGAALAAWELSCTRLPVRAVGGRRPLYPSMAPVDAALDMTTREFQT